ncbi:MULTISPECIES: ABC transporter ATP-binding protein [Saccharibacillus]|uniref:ABC transporter ATP-binding protein n=1 Tax=Saccharibacillus brassicae TaxID=2583377 RepID=A0A4Y6UTR0_SACBS|nr:MULTISPECIES: ABC transporter ATP-binding protein [Saccharibacillus]MWJ30262.1 ATP-binding cassette domain-containing protein [Saccharibacillus sp. WB 17]QDH19385.1 ABC transporter ATP-binding protein [Saccharibacillus brassicae]
MNKHAILHASNLCKTYSTGSEQFHAIKNVDLDIYEGDFTVIMGNSGSGKSTLLYLLSGLDGITTGEVYFRSQRIDTYSEKQISNFRTHKIGYIYQSINLVPDLSVVENISLPGYIAGGKKSDVRAKAVSLMRAMDIEGQKDRLPAQTSGGQQQRAAIARALINDPEVVFADEPTGSLNYEHGMAVLDILTGINRKGQSVVMVTHDIKAACRADRLVYIHDGKVAGILEFEKYDEKTLPGREEAIFAFVSGKEQRHVRRVEA